MLHCLGYGIFHGPLSSSSVVVIFILLEELPKREAQL